MYVACGLLSDARKPFDEMSKRDFNSWVIMIAGHADNGECEEVVKLFIDLEDNELFSVLYVKD